MTPEKDDLSKTRDFVIPLIVFYSITAFTATILNGLVIFTIWKTPLLQTPSRLLLCSLALTDLLVGAVLQPAAITYHLLALMKLFEVRARVSLVTSQLGYGLATVSLTNLLVIAVDRYLAIKTKHSYKSIMTKKRTIISIIVLWTVPGTFMVILRNFDKGNESDDNTKIVMAVLVIFLLTITALYVSCFYLLKKLYSQVEIVAAQPPTNQSTSDFNVWKYKRSLITMAMVLGLLLLSFLPFTIYLSVSTRSEVFANPWIMHVCESFVILNSTLNPILYLFRMRDLRQSMKNIIFTSSM